MNISMLDVVIFAAYFIGVVLLGVIVAARSKTKSSADFFLASKKLPWYAVGASFIASNISSEHFIGMVGWGFLYGMAVANWEWGNVVTFSALIWIFLPFYMRGNVSTMPEFLELRFNKACRYIYAVVMIIGLVIAMLGGVLFAGAKAISIFLPSLKPWMAILMLALAAGTYTVYGGLLSAVWADLLQYILLMAGGIVVTIYGLFHCGGLRPLFENLPEKFIMFYPASHEMIPWTGLVFGIFSVGVWYSCANQFMVQRCLGARSEWDARMGVVMAGFSKALLPLIVTVPGIIAFYLFQDRISDGDQSWPFLVRQFLPTGLVGLVLAGLASAILSTLSAITNSSATIFTLDLYKSIFRPGAGDRELHLVGRLSGAAAMVVGVIVAMILAVWPGLTVFQLIQTVFFYVAPPVAAAFLVGIIWPGATPLAATATLVMGFCVFLPAVVLLVFPCVDFLAPYDNFMYHTAAIFALSVITLVVVSFFSKPKDAQKLKGLVWSRSALGIGAAEKAKGRSFASLAISWAVMAGIIVCLYIYTNTRGSNTTCFEAEKLAYHISSGANARIQKRAELAGSEKFNLWTGPGQLLFTPAADGQEITVSLAVEKSGLYRIGAIVTTGPDYAKFTARVNGQNCDITYPVTRISPGSRKFSVTCEKSAVFDAGAGHSDASGSDSIAGRHTVRRIGLGAFELGAGPVEISFIAGQRRLIGIDQLMLTRLGPAKD